MELLMNNARESLQITQRGSKSPASHLLVVEALRLDIGDVKGNRRHTTLKDFYPQTSSSLSIVFGITSFQICQYHFPLKIIWDLLQFKRRGVERERPFFCSHWWITNDTFHSPVRNPERNFLLV
ncbi:hypothetical protein CEXT_74821 [Caerostris extrusa]|uniref:Uncharacterized protein n=1 Tax=Caerostris extrusa TaxID=172846 RepID=A0AAV4S3R8_CAEEX|nr:hypothetical protein CEXT_74821 [Caerostris extrusa]